MAVQEHKDVLTPWHSGGSHDHPALHKARQTTLPRLPPTWASASAA
jgi:hypothetical protein